MYYCISRLIQKEVMYLWEFQNDRPIYKQLVEKLEIFIVTGVYPPGSKLLSVRELAQISGVNPNTMQRALQELEDHMLVYSKRTSGRFVTEDMKQINKVKEELAETIVKNFIQDMKKLGIEKKDMIAYLRKEENK